MAWRKQVASDFCGASDGDPEKVFDYYQVRQEQLKATGRYKVVTKPLATVSAAPATELLKD